VERSRDAAFIAALTDDTQNATCRIREIERRRGSTKLDSNDVVKERFFCLQKGSAIAFQPAQMVLPYKGHLDIARNGLLVSAKRRGTTKNGSHGSTRNNILSAISH
jgi:hypothetical protein